MSERKSDKSRPRTRQALKNLEEGSDEKKSRRSEGHHSSSHPEHIKKCFICYTEVERQAALRKKRQRQSAPATVTAATVHKPSTSNDTATSIREPIELSEEDTEPTESPRTPEPQSPAVITEIAHPDDLEIKRENIAEFFEDIEEAVVDTEKQKDNKQKSENEQTLAPVVDRNKEPKQPATEFELVQTSTPIGLRSASQKLENLYTEIALSPDSIVSAPETASSETTLLTKNTETQLRGESSGLFAARLDSVDFSKPLLNIGSPHTPAVAQKKVATSTAVRPGYTRRESSHTLAVAVATPPTATLASTTKSQQQPSSKTPAAVPPPPTAAHTQSVNNIPLPNINSAPKTHMTSTGPMTRMKSQGVGALDGHHQQISATNIDEATLDQCFQVQPKWHYVKSNHDETAQWFESANYESILLELLYFAHDQGHIQHKDMESQFEKELDRAVESIEKLECLDSFCKTFIRDNRFRPTGKVVLTGSSKDEKNNRLFRMINADLQNLKRQHRILSMVCNGTADHEVHTQAQRENLRKLVEDLVTIVHPGDRGTLSEVYKVISESAVYDQKGAKPLLSSLKVVSHPDIVVPFGGPIMAGGSLIRCDALEQRIRAKLPSLLIKMHFSDRPQDQKWPDLTKGDDSGIGTLDDTGIIDDTGTGSSRPRSKDRADDKSKSSGSSSKSSGKRKHEETTPSRSKRHREDLYTRETQPPDAHVINEIYGEHVSQLLCSLTSSPVGYIKHCKYTVPSSDDRDGSSSVTVLGMIVSGEDVYLTKMDATHDYLDSLVETFRMDQLSFSCMANPLNLYKGTHLKALLMYLRYICLNFPRTTYFLSD